MKTKGNRLVRAWLWFWAGCLLVHCGPGNSNTVRQFATEIAGASCGTVDCIAAQADEEILILHED